MKFTAPPAAPLVAAVDVGGYPAALPVNVVAHRGCEHAARTIIRRAREERERGTK
jgi:hypothetical protein